MKTDIVKYIPELLCRHDCVIIPGFGGFIGNYSPATINPVYHTFYPPFKSLLLNIHLKQNDGLLASWISRNEHIPYDHSMDLIRVMLEEWNLELDNNGELIIDKVGKIIKEADGILQFEQDMSVNFLPEAYGLTTLVSPAIRRPGMQDKIEKKITRYIQTPSGKPGKLSRSLKWAAVMALPIGLTLYLSLTNIEQIRSFHENYSGLLFPNSISILKKNFNSSKTVALPAKSAKPAVKHSAPVQQVESSSVNQTVKTDIQVNAAADVNKPYAIIVGAFRFRENADNLVAKLKQEGYRAGIFDMTKTGLFRVSVGTYDSWEDASRQLAVVRSGNYTSAWLLSK